MATEKRKLEQDTTIQRPLLNRPPRDVHRVLGDNVRKSRRTNHKATASTIIEKESLSKEEMQLELKALREKMHEDVRIHKGKITSSAIYSDEKYHYRHITLPKEIANYLPEERCLLKESEYRQLGIEISPGWEHYMIHAPEPHILLLRRTHEMTKKVMEERKLAEEKKLKEKALKKKQQQPSTDSSSTSTIVKKPLPSESTKSTVQTKSIPQTEKEK
ncbi:unnamed protein product [Cunninghamella blakesleeana]